MVDIDEYGEFVDKLWMGGVSLDERDLTIASLGLAGEGAEVVEVILEALYFSKEIGHVSELMKKRARDGNFNVTKLKKELGDVAYYWARLCTAFGLKPSEVLGANVEKLEGRLTRGTLGGSGNDR